MASLIRPMMRSRRSVLVSTKAFIQTPQLQEQYPTSFIAQIQNQISQSSTTFQAIRTYLSETMYKSAVESNIPRLLSYEIQYEFDHSPPLQPVTKFGSFVVDERAGEQWIILRRKFEENEEVKIEATMFDGSFPASKPKKSIGDPVVDVEPHITFIVNIIKNGGGEMMQFLCSAWSNSMEIKKVFMHGADQMLAHPYKGPPLKELDDELQNSLYEFLETRGINDQLAVFLHKYMANKDKTEYIRWMGNVKSFVEQK